MKTLWVLHNNKTKSQYPEYVSIQFIKSGGYEKDDQDLSVSGNSLNIGEFEPISHISLRDSVSSSPDTIFGMRMVNKQVS